MKELLVTDIVEQIQQLKKNRNAVILAHNYQLAEVQDIADFTGDSLELARKAANLKEDVVVFCGVHFMAETAAMLSPQKIVLLPDAHAGCPMADMATGDDVRALKQKHPNAVVVCYVNSTADVKAVSDVCCTSANAVDIVNRIPENKDIIFVPDKYLGGHVSRMTGRDIILFDGYCPTHAKQLVSHIEAARNLYPGAPVIVHPESRKDVCLAADAALSTGQMCAYAKNSDAQTIIVGTEVGLLHRLRKENPEKTFVPLLEQAICMNMKKITLEKILWSLEELEPRITVPDDIASQANAAVLAMLGDGPIGVNP
ncbi:MAG: quinolinate synthase NadA [Deltaproteobacteria bacterium]|nr:quinolinate synthase NadA [Deltaproteobacteria bacterium]MBN2672177.1 quinolinate synthase NadA [Deltaproteobacteria bacterium]